MTASNLHRELAPISKAAWADIEEECSRTFKRNIAGRRIVDMPEPCGLTFSALGTGHFVEGPSKVEGVQMVHREVIPAVELKVPFTVSRKAVDDVLRGSVDSDWQPVKDAATTLAKAEDSIVFNGVNQSGMRGIIQASSNETITVPENITEFPNAVAQALTQLRLVGVEGPYMLAVSAELYTAIAETTVMGYPILKHLQRELGEGKIIWAPAIDGAVMVSERGGDFELHLGQDVSIGYDSHDRENVHLYLQETLVFRVATDEAAVVLA